MSLVTVGTRTENGCGSSVMHWRKAQEVVEDLISGQDVLPKRTCIADVEAGIIIVDSVDRVIHSKQDAFDPYLFGWEVVDYRRMKDQFLSRLLFRIALFRMGFVNRLVVGE